MALALTPSRGGGGGLVPIGIEARASADADVESDGDGNSDGNGDGNGDGAAARDASPPEAAAWASTEVSTLTQLAFGAASLRDTSAPLAEASRHPLASASAAGCVRK